ncbi:MAG: response regulator receiver protein [Myxococcales bacterium]|nr:response regulator receiver protein [Myxococcales bacterium]
MTMLNILLVDDEPDVRISLGQVLREEGHAVDMVADAETALMRLSAHPFDLVVSDVKLPKLDGLSLLKRVRGEFPATEVLLMTAYGTISDAVTAMKDSAMDYLTKPFDLDVLVTAVGRVETRRRERDEHVAPAAGNGVAANGNGTSPTLAEAMEEYEKEIILRTVRGAGERRQRAAKMLGISRKSLWKKLTKYGLQTRRHQSSEGA